MLCVEPRWFGGTGGDRQRECPYISSCSYRPNALGRWRAGYRGSKDVHELLGKGESAVAAIVLRRGLIDDVRICSRAVKPWNSLGVTEIDTGLATLDAVSPLH